MSYLVRNSRQTIWTGDEQVTEERRADAIATFSRRDVDTDGVSLFAVENDTEERLIVAAYACQKREGPNKLDILRLNNSEVEQFGAVTVDNDAGLAVRSVNRLHRALAWSEEDLRRLVDRLLEIRQRTTRYTPAQVTDAVVALDLEDVEDGPHREWVLKVKLRRGVA